MIHYTNNYIPGKLTVTGLETDWHGDISFDQFSYEDEDVKVELISGDLKWRILPLMLAQVYIPQFDVNTLSITIKEENTPSNEPTITPDVHIPLGISLRNVDIAKLEIITDPQSPEVFENIHLRARMFGSRIRLQLYQMSYALFSLSGKARTSLKHPYQFDGNFEFGIDDESQLSGTIDLSGDEHLVQAKARLNNTSPESLLITAQASDIFNEIQWRASLYAKELDVSTLNTHAPHGKVTGVVRVNHPEKNPTEVQLSSNLYLFPEDKKQPNTHLIASALFGDKGMTLSELSLSADPSRYIRLTGQWDETIKPEKWHATLVGKGLNPAWFYPEWPGNINIHMNGNGTEDENHHEYQFAFSELQGTLLKKPFNATGNIHGKNDHILASSLSIHSGDSSLTMDGKLTDQWDLQAEFISQNLNQLFEDLNGSVKIQSHMDGPRQSPTLTTEISSQSFEWYHQEWNQLSLKTHAQFSEQKMNATVNEFSFRGPFWGTWKLHQPASFIKENGQMEITEFCLDSHDALPPASSTNQLCFAANWLSEQSWNAQLKGTNLPLSPLTTYLPVGIFLKGSWDISANWKQDGLSANIHMPTGMIDYKLWSNLYIPPIQYKEADLQLAWNKQQGLSSQFNWVVNQNDFLNASITLPNYLPFPQENILAFKDQTLSGDFHAELTDLSIIDVILPPHEDTSGSFFADLKLSGLIDHPDVNGEMKLVNGHTELPALGLELSNINATFNGEGKQWHLDANLKSGKGTLNATASLDTSNLTGHGKLFGHDVQVMNTQHLNVYASPDLNFTLTETDANINGNVLIPETNINLKIAEDNYVQPSSDVVYIDQTEEEPKKQHAIFKRTTKVQIRMGDKVRFSGYGLEGRIAGELQINEQPDRLATGQGELSVVDGRFEAYGQSLTIETGRVIFRNVPLSNPTLDVLATKTFNNQTVDNFYSNETVVAGVRVTGSVNNPLITLTSRPALPESEILSYLVLGYGLQQSNREDADKLNNAAGSLGVGAGQMVARQLSNTLGFAEVTVSAANGSDSTAVNVGKRITPRLYISYGVGVFDAVNTFRTRYKISRHFDIEGSSSTENAVDVFYTLETG